jgi:hypothetical protein
LRKVNILLKAIDNLGKEVEYYAVDLSLPELQRTFAQIPTGTFEHLLSRLEKIPLHVSDVRAVFCLHEASPII